MEIDHTRGLVIGAISELRDGRNNDHDGRGAPANGVIFVREGGETSRKAGAVRRVERILGEYGVIVVLEGGETSRNAGAVRRVERILGDYCPATPVRYAAWKEF